MPDEIPTLLRGLDASDDDIKKAREIIDDLRADGLRDGDTAPLYSLTYRQINAMLLDGMIYLEDSRKGSRFVTCFESDPPAPLIDDTEPVTVIDDTEPDWPPIADYSKDLIAPIGDPLALEDCYTSDEHDDPKAYRGALCKYIRGLSVVYNNRDFYQFDDTKYAAIGEEGVEYILYNCVPEGSMTSHDADEIIKTLRNTALFTHLKAPDDFDADRYSGTIVAFQNGWLNLDTHEWIHPTPYRFISMQIQARYDPSAVCPDAERIWRTMFPDDDTWQFIREYIGWVICGGYAPPNIVVFQGPQSSGKSAVAKVIAYLLGHDLGDVPRIPTPTDADHAAFFKMDQLSDRFNEYLFVNKRLCYCDEIGSYDLADDALLKTASAHGSIKIEGKYRRPYNTNPDVALLFSTNPVPKFSTHKDGMDRRIHAVPFVHHQWHDDDRILDVLLSPEARSWLISQCVDANIRRAGGDFHVSSEMMKLHNDIFQASDQIYDFAETIFGGVDTMVSDLVDNGWTPQDAYDRYRDDYCINAGIKPLSKSKFLARLREYGITADSDVRKINGKTTRIPLFRKL